MKYKKLLAVALSLSLITACGKGATNSNQDNAEIITEITEPVEITFWHAMNGEQEKALQKLTDDFTNKNTNIKITLQNQSSYQDLQQKLTSTLASPKDLPTITQAYPDWMINAVEDNLLVDLGVYINNDTLKFDNYDDILPSFRESAKINGTIYGMPFNKSTEVIWYNKTLLDELNLQPPTTYEELANVAKEIKDKKGIIGAGFDSLNTYYTTYLKKEGVVFDSNFDPTSKESINAVNYYLDGIKEGYFRIAGTDKYLSGPLANETIAMYIGSNAGETFVKNGVGDKFEVAAAPYPSKPSIQQGTDIYMFSSATPEQRTAAYEFLKFLTTTENQISWAKETGYIPVRKSAIDSDEYKNSGSLIAPILADATNDLYTNPIERGVDTAFREAGTALESILASPNSDINKKLEDLKNSLMSIWE